MQLIPIFNTQNTEQISTADFNPLLSKEECQEIIDTYTTEEPIKAKTAGDIVDKRRDTLIHPIPYNEISKDLYEKIADRVARSNQFGFDFDISGIYEGRFAFWVMGSVVAIVSLIVLVTVVLIKDKSSDTPEFTI